MGYTEAPQTGKETTSTRKPVTKYPETFMKLDINVCVFKCNEHSK